MGSRIPLLLGLAIIASLLAIPQPASATKFAHFVRKISDLTTSFFDVDPVVEDDEFEPVVVSSDFKPGDSLEMSAGDLFGQAMQDLSLDDDSIITREGLSEGGRGGVIQGTEGDDVFMSTENFAFVNGEIVDKDGTFFRSATDEERELVSSLLDGETSEEVEEELLEVVASLEEEEEDQDEFPELVVGVVEVLDEPPNDLIISSDDFDSALEENFDEGDEDVGNMDPFGKELEEKEEEEHIIEEMDEVEEPTLEDFPTSVDQAVNEDGEEGDFSPSILEVPISPLPAEIPLQDEEDLGDVDDEKEVEEEEELFSTVEEPEDEDEPIESSSEDNEEEQTATVVVDEEGGPGDFFPVREPVQVPGDEVVSEAEERGEEDAEEVSSVFAAAADEEEDAEPVVDLPELSVQDEGADINEEKEPEQEGGVEAEIDASRDEEENEDIGTSAEEEKNIGTSAEEEEDTGTSAEEEETAEVGTKEGEFTADDDTEEDSPVSLEDDEGPVDLDGESELTADEVVVPGADDRLETSDGQDDILLEASGDQEKDILLETSEGQDDVPDLTLEAEAEEAGFETEISAPLEDPSSALDDVAEGDQGLPGEVRETSEETSAEDEVDVAEEETAAEEAENRKDEGRISQSGDQSGEDEEDDDSFFDFFGIFGK